MQRGSMGRNPARGAELAEPLRLGDVEEAGDPRHDKVAEGGHVVGEELEERVLAWVEVDVFAVEGEGDRKEERRSQASAWPSSPEWVLVMERVVRCGRERGAFSRSATSKEKSMALSVVPNNETRPRSRGALAG